MPRKPGNLNPEGSGRGSMPALGRSSQSTSAAANKKAGAGSRAAKLFERGAKMAEARLKAEFKAKGLDWNTGLPINKAAAAAKSAQLRAQAAAYRASLRSDRVKELETRLNFPKKAK